MSNQVSEWSVEAIASAIYQTEEQKAAKLAEAEAKLDAARSNRS